MAESPPSPTLPTATVEHGRWGRVVYARIAPNEDLVHSVEKLCVAQRFAHAWVRGGLGSLTDACLARSDGSISEVRGPAAEVASLQGEVRTQADGSLLAILNGVVVDSAGRVHGGRFLPGSNPVCVTIEITLEEWLPDTPSSLHPAATAP